MKCIVVFFLALLVNGCLYVSQCTNWPSCPDGHVMTWESTTRPAGQAELGCGWFSNEHWRTCCPTCKLHQCGSTGQAIPARAGDNIDGKDAQTLCCELTCQGWNKCPANWVLKPSNVVGSDQATCCEQQTCAAWNGCPPGWELISSASGVVYDGSITSCCELCNSGEYSDGAKCTFCDGGKVPETLDRCCNVCDEGQILKGPCEPNNRGSCSTCPVGTKSVSNSCECVSISDGSCKSLPPPDGSVWILPGTDRIGRGMDITFLGDSSKLKFKIMELDDPPLNGVNPRSESLPADQCNTFHDDASHTWYQKQVQLTQLTASGCSERSQKMTSFNEVGTATAEEFGFQIGAEYKDVAAGIGYNTARSKSVRSRIESGQYVVESSCSFKLYSLSLSSEKYSQEFKDAVKDLPTTYSSHAYEAFIQSWGTHVVTSSTMGGELRRSSSISTKECWYDSEESVVDFVTADFSGITQGVAVETDGEYAIGDTSSQTSDQSNMKVSSSWTSLGGNSALVEGKNTICTQAWRASTYAFADMLDHTLKPIYSAVYQAAVANGEDSTTAGSKSKAVEQAIVAHLRSTIAGATSKSAEPIVCGATRTHWDFFAFFLAMHVQLMWCF